MNFQQCVLEYVLRMILRNAGLRTTGLEDLYPCLHGALGSDLSVGSWVLCSCSHHTQKDSLCSISLGRDHSLVSQSPDPPAFLRLSQRGRDTDVFPYRGRRWPGFKLVPRALGQDLFQHLVHHLSCHHNDPLLSV